MQNNEIKELNNQFVEFLQSKGLKAKYNLVVENLKESIEKQKAISAEENKEFVEFLQTKGFKAKVKLVVENIKKGVKESNERVKAQIEESKKYRYNGVKNVTAQDLTNEFNEFLQAKGLNNKYNVVIEEIK